MSRYIKITAGTPYCGTEEDFFYIVDDDTTEEFINDFAEEILQRHVESFEYLATGWDEDWESEEQKENYYADCYVSWEEISKEEFWEECNE